MPIINLCTHCSTICTGKYCSDCATAEKRREMDEVNRKHFEENNLPPYICKVCELEREIRKKNTEERLKFGK